jgi:hypothetical protein
MDAKQTSLDAMFAEFDQNVAVSRVVLQYVHHRISTFHIPSMILDWRVITMQTRDLSNRAAEAQVARKVSINWPAVRKTAIERAVTECPICMTQFRMARPQVTLCSCSALLLRL